MQLIKSDSVFVARCTYDERHIPKAAGFRWDPAARRWWTGRAEVAAHLKEYASAELAATLPEPGEVQAASRPAPTLALRPDGLGWMFSCEREHNEPAKAAGLRWNRALNAWDTSDPSAAMKLRAFASPEVAEELDRLAAAREAARLASRATDADIDLPRPEGLNYLGYQKAGIAYALAKPGVLIGDEMGLGKTIQAIGILNSDPSLSRILIICPATLKLNWRRELRKWSIRPCVVSLATTTDWTEPPTEEGKVAITIAHYDIFSRATRTAERIRAAAWDMMVVDEAHLLKNPKAGRTRLILGAAEDAKTRLPAIASIQSRRNVFLTGTPIVNRPIELWPLVSFLAPQAFPNWFDYARQFCGMEKGRHGTKITGATNLDALQDKLRETVMIRRLKRDVLAELPAKLRQVIELPANGAASLVQREGSALAQHEARIAALRTAVELAKAAENQDEYEAAIAALRQGMTTAFTDLSRLRHEVALAKVPDVIAHVRDAAGEAKVILFAHHRDVIEALAHGLADLHPVQIHGGVPIDQRQAAVDTFQQDARCRLFVGQMTAAGVGITLTASSHVVFAELDWVPGNVSQCEDRAHRIGQENSVLVQHLVLEGSLDARMAQVLVEKQRVLDGALDLENAEAREARRLRTEAAMAEAEARVRAAGPAPDMAERITAARAQVEREAQARELRRPIELGGQPSTADARREALEAEGREMTRGQIAAVHQGLRILAGMDTDRAAARNDVGFNSADTGIGHALAERDFLTPRAAALGRKLLRKYHRQLGAALLEEMGVQPRA